MNVVSVNGSYIVGSQKPKEYKIKVKQLKYKKGKSVIIDEDK